MEYVKSITHHHSTTKKKKIKAAATAKETTSNLKRMDFRWHSDMVQHLINSVLGNKWLTAS